MKHHKILPQNFWIETNKRLFPQETMLLVYLMNSPHINRLGCFRLPLRFIKVDLNFSDKVFSNALNELIDHNYLVWDGYHEWGYLTHFLEWFPIHTYYQARNLEKDFDTLNETTNVYKRVIEHLLQILFLDRSFRHRLHTIWHQVISHNAAKNDEQEASARHRMA